MVQEVHHNDLTAALAAPVAVLDLTPPGAALARCWDPCWKK